MTSLLIAAQRGPVPADEAIVRSTTAIVNDDAPAAEMPDAPDYNETETDPNPYLGMTSRQVASHVIASEKYVPPTMGEANAEHNEIVNRQVSTSGTAAAREAAGVWGHGTMQIVEGIEPTIRPGTEFGPEYFTAGERGAQEGVSSYMTPAQVADPATEAQAGATAQAGSRDAVNASMFQAYLDSVTGTL